MRTGRAARRPWGRRRDDPRLARAAELAAAVGGSPEQCAALAAQALALAQRGDRALVAAFGDLARTGEDPAGAQGRLLVQLVDLEQRPTGEAAALLGLDAAAVPALLAEARTVAGGPAGEECRGWGLASRPPGQSGAERAAGDAHLALCRRCADRRRALERQRTAVHQRAAAVAALTGGGHLVGAPLWSGGSGLLAGKVTAAAVGALGAAVVATGTTALVAGPLAHPHRPHPAPSGAVAGDPTSSAGCARACPTPAASAPATPGLRGAGPSLPVPLETALTGTPPVDPSVGPRPGLDLPTGLLPKALLPTVLPLPLPTQLPTQLPTSLPLLPTTLPTLPTLLPTPLPTALSLP